jgi:hypothetical protein
MAKATNHAFPVVTIEYTPTAMSHHKKHAKIHEDFVDSSRPLTRLKYFAVKRLLRPYDNGIPNKAEIGNNHTALTS